MCAMGHGEKNSRRAYLVCIAPIIGIRNCCRAGLDRARSGHSPTRLRITAFDPLRKFGSVFSMTGVDPQETWIGGPEILVGSIAGNVRPIFVLQ
jgi:hypothetical protein